MIYDQMKNGKNKFVLTIKQINIPKELLNKQLPPNPQKNINH